MKKLILIAIILGLISCGDKAQKNSAKIKALKAEISKNEKAEKELKITLSEIAKKLDNLEEIQLAQQKVIEAQQGKKVPSAIIERSSVNIDGAKIQISATSFLNGGAERCSFDDKPVLIYLSKDSEKLICSNSAIEVKLINKSGTLIIKGFDKKTGEEIMSKFGKSKQSLKLGNFEWAFYTSYVDGRYFTAISARDVSGVRDDLLNDFNIANKKKSELFFRILKLKNDKVEISEELSKSYESANKELEEIRLKIKNQLKEDALLKLEKESEEPEQVDED